MVLSDQSIKARIRSSMVVVTIMSLVVTALSFFYYDRQATSDAMIKELQILAKVIAHRSTAALTFGDKRNSQTNLDALSVQKNILKACIIKEGVKGSEVFAKLPTTLETPACQLTFTKSLADLTAAGIEIIEPIEINERIIGYVYIQSSLEPLYERLTGFVITGLCILLIVGVLNAAFANWQAARLSAPIINLSNIAHRVSEENNYELRATTESKDEIGDLVHQFNDMMDKIQTARNELQAMAFFDPLTNLPNRRYYTQKLNIAFEKAKLEKINIGVLLIDLDGFKKVNDTLGHDAGDAVLIHVSQRLGTLIRENDIASRLGGDEFTVMLWDVNIELASQLCRDIIQKIQIPVPFQDTFAKVSASIGLAFSNDFADVSILMKHADEAMYTAKQQGKNDFVIAKK
ncbi:MAG: diguanylate cyclase [Pseudomonadota bacterium]